MVNDKMVITEKNLVEKNLFDINQVLTEVSEHLNNFSHKIAFLLNNENVKEAHSRSEFLKEAEKDNPSSSSLNQSLKDIKTFIYDLNVRLLNLMDRIDL